MRSMVLALALAGCGGDPCAGLGEEMSLVLAGADVEGNGFEPFADGAERPLVWGPQGGMHVWMSARITGLCPTTTVLERRVVDDATSDVYVFGRGPVEFTETEAAGTFELSDGLAMIVCPQPRGFPVVGQRLRMVAAAEDGEGRVAEAEIAFVPACPEGVDCAAICAP